MPEFLDDKLHSKWNILPTRKLVIWLYHRIAKRLEALETNAGITPPVIDEKEPDIDKIKRPANITP